MSCLKCDEMVEKVVEGMTCRRDGGAGATQPGALWIARRAFEDATTEMKMIIDKLAAMTGAAVVALFLASPASALTMAECSVKYNAAKEIGRASCRERV